MVQTSWNQLPATVTGSLKVTLRSVFDARSVAPLVGVVAVTEGATSVVKLNTTSAASVSGGSAASESATWAANSVTVQVSPPAKSTVGLIVQVVGPPVTTASATPRVPLV